jgi:hypothetical protein
MLNKGYWQLFTVPPDFVAQEGARQEISCYRAGVHVRTLAWTHARPIGDACLQLREQNLLHRKSVEQLETQLR